METVSFLLKIIDGTALCDGIAEKISDWLRADIAAAEMQGGYTE